MSKYLNINIHMTDKQKDKAKKYHFNQHTINRQTNRERNRHTATAIPSWKRQFP